MIIPVIYALEADSVAPRPPTRITPYVVIIIAAANSAPGLGRARHLSCPNIAY